MSMEMVGMGVWDVPGSVWCMPCLCRLLCVIVNTVCRDMSLPCVGCVHMSYDIRVCAVFGVSLKDEPNTSKTGPMSSDIGRLPIQ